YKLRDKISKALKTCSEAIRCAIAVYNDAGAALNPLRKHIMFADIIHTTSLAEFNLLCEMQADIHEQAWTQPTYHEAGILYFGIKHVKEEIECLKIEILRLIMYLVDEHIDYYTAIALALIVNPLLAMELQQRWLHASRISTSICKHLASTVKLVIFSGSLFPDIREGRDPDLGDNVQPPYWLAVILSVTQMEVEYNEAAAGAHLDMEPD
ncbi:hypothetical protein B0H17DRAFT_929031, partial [Mycena rosella]